MRLAVDRTELQLDRPFGISRGTVETTETVLVRLTHDEQTGLGAAAPSPYYGETPDTVEVILEEFQAVMADLEDPHAIQAVQAEMADRVGGNPAAKAAIDVALHDLAAIDAGLPLYRYLGLDGSRTITSSYTISLADTPRMRRWAEEATRAGFEVLKVKLGGAQDPAVLEAVREVAPEATVRVDANGAWGPHEAVRLCELCGEYDVQLVEQPIPDGNPEELRFVRNQSPVPIAADESCQHATDVARVSDAADVVVVKLMKMGGIREALAAIHTAKAHGLDVMLGCMLETNVTIAAAAHLTPLVDFADLDGSLLLAEDPFHGVPMREGEIDLRDVELTGTGARADHAASTE